MSFVLLLPAAGDGVRLGLNIPKALIEIGGLPLFVQAVNPFLDLSDCREIVIAAPPVLVRRFESLATWFLPNKSVRVVSGGLTRQESVRLALEALRDSDDPVLVHDAARPFVTHDLISRVLTGLNGNFAGCAPSVSLSDTIKLAAGDPLVVDRTVNRNHLYAVQTPQALHRKVAQEAFARLGQDPFEGTDDMSLIEHFGLGRVHLVEGDPRNTKITTPADLQYARERFA